MSERALHVHFPELARAVPFGPLGVLPTPVEPLEALRARLGPGTPALWVKRDDRSAEAYGGNKVRTLEVLFADALAHKATHIVSTGAFGSNHAAATVLHARRVGLSPGAMLFPQPDTQSARENLAVTLTHGADVEELPHWSFLPYGLARMHLRDRVRGRRSYVMVPGGATPLGALGYVSAAFELAEQVARGELPAPRRVVVAVGSTCTTAGLLLGFALAARRRLGFREVPTLHAVRVTPWPVTSHGRIVQLAERAAALMAEHGALGDTRGRTARPTFDELAAHLVVDGGYLGLGYGRVTRGGLDAIARFAVAGGPPLDTGYSGKSGAAFLDLARERSAGPLLFWATKSSAPLPPAFEPGPSGQGRDAEVLMGLPRMRAFLS